MGNSWEIKKLGDFVSLQRGHDLPSTKRIGGNIPIMGSFGITGFHNEFKVDGPGVTIGRSGGSMGVVNYIEKKYWPLNTVLYVTDFKENDPFFTYLLLSQIDFSAYNSGSAQPSLNRNFIYGINVKVPSLSIQKSIAKIIKELDDKIELNRQMNKTLEQMAQALFKSWFVDFDPVIDNALQAGNKIPEPLQKRAQQRKALGEKRKSLPQQIQQLFPTEIEFSEELDKWMPMGWRVSAIGNEFEVTMGQSPPGSTYNQEDEGMPFFQGRVDFQFRYPQNRIYCSAPKRIAEAGDTLVTVRAPVGDINMAIIECCIGRGVAAVRHKSKSSSYTYYSMLQLKKVFQNFEGEGTIFGSINQKDFKSIPWLRVSNELVIGFTEQCISFDDKILNNSRQIESLTKLRETLLLKLVSGEVKIPNEIFENH